MSMAGRENTGPAAWSTVFRRVADGPQGQPRFFLRWSRHSLTSYDGYSGGHDELDLLMAVCEAARFRCARRGLDSPMNVSSFEIKYFVADGGLEVYGGNYFFCDPCQGAYVQGFHALRFFVAALGLRQPRLLRGERFRPSIAELEDEARCRTNYNDGSGPVPMAVAAQRGLVCRLSDEAVVPMKGWDGDPPLKATAEIRARSLNAHGLTVTRIEAGDFERIHFRVPGFENVALVVDRYGAVYVDQHHPTDKEQNLDRGRMVLRAARDLVSDLFEILQPERLCTALRDRDWSAFTSAWSGGVEVDLPADRRARCLGRRVELSGDLEGLSEFEQGAVTLKLRELVEDIETIHSEQLRPVRGSVRDYLDSMES